MENCRDLSSFEEELGVRFSAARNEKPQNSGKGLGESSSSEEASRQCTPAILGNNAAGTSSPEVAHQQDFEMLDVADTDEVEVGMLVFENEDEDTEDAIPKFVWMGNLDSAETEAPASRRHSLPSSGRPRTFSRRRQRTLMNVKCPICYQSLAGRYAYKRHCRNDHPGWE